MTPLMPDAPQAGAQAGAQASGPQNALMRPQGGPPGGGGMPGGMMPPQNALMAQGAPPAPAPPPSPEQVAEARKHLGAIMGALTKVAATPRGDLTKKDVFDAAAEMIARGGFPTAASRQSLIVTLANMPDDEPDLRKAIGRMMLRVAQVSDAFRGVHGAGESAPLSASPPQAMGAPNAGV